MRRKTLDGQTDGPPNKSGRRAEVGRLSVKLTVHNILLAALFQTERGWLQRA